MSSPPPHCAVVAYPTLTASDRDWIESVRARHDPQADLIAAHVTLGFPAPVTPAALVRDAAQAAGAWGAVPFAVGIARAVPDRNGGAYVFLVIDDGREAITALHQSVSSGTLAPHRRSDILFIPHITVAAHGDPAWCRDFADNLNRRLPRMRGTIDALDVVAIGADHVETLARLTLGARRGD